jgi:DNA-binding protein YbaB
MLKVQEEMATRTAGASAGRHGGLGEREAGLVSIKVEKVINPKMPDAQDLIVAAVFRPEKTQEMVAEEMKKLTGGINIPGLI